MIPYHFNIIYKYIIAALIKSIAALSYSHDKFYY